MRIIALALLALASARNQLSHEETVASGITKSNEDTVDRPVNEKYTVLRFNFSLADDALTHRLFLLEAANLAFI